MSAQNHGDEFLGDHRGSPLLPLQIGHWQTHARYQYGIDLFNHGFWWEAHEAWEAVWQASNRQSLIGPFLQGLIQYAAFLLKVYSDRERNAALRLAKRAEARLSHVIVRLAAASLDARAAVGIDLPTWIVQASAFVEDVQQHSALWGKDPRLHPAFPQLVL